MLRSPQCEPVTPVPIMMPLIPRLVLLSSRPEEWPPSPSWLCALPRLEDAFPEHAKEEWRVWLVLFGRG